MPRPFTDFAAIVGRIVGAEGYRYVGELVWKHVQYVRILARLYPLYRRIKASKDRYSYTDLAIAEAGSNEFETLDMFTETMGGTAAVASMRRHEEVKASVRAASAT